ncbi:MAG: hypothetical protein JO211_16615 [Acidobacteriaceae bacterium]|nr:hypothetical protein [Acidobacteriaceae bacterium]
MFGSEILDAAIGLILVFLLLSLVCSSAREAIETVFKQRARLLHMGITEMLGKLDGVDPVSEFYKQPLINGLFLGPYDPSKPRRLPSYIPPRTFVMATMHMVMTMTKEADVKAAVAALPDGSDIKGALWPLINEAGADTKLMVRNVEDWYNAAMDRVSGWYKRRSQIIIAALGFSIAIALNVDAIAITRYLNTNQTARSVLVAEAQERTQKADTSDPLSFLTRQGGIPVGWIFQPEQGQSGADFMRDMRRAPANLREWLLKIAGILFTGFAVSLGAPFWFDVLNRFMVIRSTVKPEEKSPEEKSKD